MANDVNELQSRIAIVVDQTTTAPTAGGAEWNLRLKYLNRSYDEWLNAYDWEATRITQYLTLTGTNQASITLPTDFRKMAAYPINYSTGVSAGEQWPEIMVDQTKRYTTSDRYYYILGNRSAGYTMVWNPGSLASGASIYIQYYSYPTALASPSDIPVLPDGDFLVDRAAAYLLEMRNDPKSEQMEGRAREKLLQMIDNENVKSPAYRNVVETPENKYWGFRIGRD